MDTGQNKKLMDGRAAQAGPRSRRTAGRPVWQQEGRMPGEQRTASSGHWGATGGDAQRRKQSDSRPRKRGRSVARSQSPKLLPGTQRQEPRAPLPTSFTRKIWATRQAPRLGLLSRNLQLPLPAAAESGRARGAGGGGSQPLPAAQAPPGSLAPGPQRAHGAAHQARQSWVCQFPPRPAPQPQDQMPPNAPSPFS